jgi:hypothetical protein
MKQIRILCVMLTAAFAPVLRAADLYSTDFETFPVGDNLWAGTEGWLSNDTTSGAQGILEDFVAELPLGKTAYLGFESPASTLTQITRLVNYDPVVGGFPCVEFDSFLGVQNSTNGRRDQFFISFYDISGTFLAAIVFDNRNSSAEVLRWEAQTDGSVQSSPTGVPFARGDQVLGFIALQILFTRIDLQNNSWSAYLDGIPLFIDAPFTASAFAPLSLGSVAAEWEVAGAQPSDAGNNWLFVADWYVRSAPRDTGPPKISTISRNPAGKPVITWHGEAGFDYQIEYSQDLENWLTDLPDSTFPGIMASGPLEFRDTSAAPSARYYRVRRSITP